MYFWVLVVAVLGFAASYLRSRLLRGKQADGLYAVLLLVDGVVRLAFALVVAVGIAKGPDLIAIAVAARR